MAPKPRDHVARHPIIEGLSQKNKTLEYGSEPITTCVGTHEIE